MTTFFDLSRSLNETNVVDHSPVFQEMYEDRAPKCEYVVIDHEYNIEYFLLIGIYSKQTTFIKTILFLQGSKAKPFAERQELIRKDVE